MSRKSEEMELGEYDPSRDREVVLRIYEEVGWLEEGRDKTLEEINRFYFFY